MSKPLPTVPSGTVFGFRAQLEKARATKVGDVWKDTRSQRRYMVVGYPGRHRVELAMGTVVAGNKFLYDMSEVRSVWGRTLARDFEQLSGLEPHPPLPAEPVKKTPPKKATVIIETSGGVISEIRSNLNIEVVFKLLDRDDEADASRGQKGKFAELDEELKSLPRSERLL